MLDRPHPENLVEDDLYLRVGRDGIDVGGQVLICLARSDDPVGYVFGKSESSAARTISTPDIWTMYRRRELRFVTPDELYLPPKVRELLRRTLGAFNAKERDNIVARMSFVQAIHDAGPDLPRSQSAWQPIVNEVAERLGKTRYHWTTVRRWWLLWLKGGRNHRVLAGLDREKGNRTRRLSPLQLEAIDAELGTYLQPWRARPAAVQAAVNGAILGTFRKEHPGMPDTDAPLLGYKTVWSECRRISREVRIHYRDGAQAAREGITPVYEGVETRFPFERVEADFKYVGMFVIDGDTGLPLGTPYLMAAIDRYSGAVAGYDLGFDPPGSASVSRCLRHVIERKDLSTFVDDVTGESLLRNGWPINGVPRTFIVDNDPAFVSEHFRMAAASIGSHVLWLEPRQPWKKGAIEAFWKAIGESYLAAFPGKTLRTWSKPDEEYDASEFAVLTLRDVNTLITKAIVDVHNATKDMRSGQRRLDRWVAGVEEHPPRQPPQHEDLIELIGCYAKRTAGVDGIRVFGLRYNSKDLAKYRAQFIEDPEVEVRYTTDDIGEVWVVDKKRGSFPVPCTMPEYASGLSLHQHRVIRRQHVDTGPAGRIYRSQLMVAKAELLALGRKMLGEKSTRKFRKQLARYFGPDPKLVIEAQQRLFDAEKSRRTYATEAGGVGDEATFDDEDDIAAAHPFRRATEENGSSATVGQETEHASLTETESSEADRASETQPGDADNVDGPPRRIRRRSKGEGKRGSPIPKAPAGRPVSGASEPSGSTEHTIAPPDGPAHEQNAGAGSKPAEPQRGGDDPSTEGVTHAPSPKREKKVRYARGYQRPGE